MVREIVASVLADHSNRRITVQTSASEKKSAPKEKKAEAPAKEPKKRAPRKKKTEQPVVSAEGDACVGKPCPLCGKGVIIKGKTAYGCSEWKNGCTYRKPFGS